MREYELTIVYDLAVTEAGGADASVQALTSHVESRGGRLLRADRWGRRRMAYPINGAIDGDYIISRVELDPSAVKPLQEALRIDERVYRHLVVRADELPPPPVPREPRRRPEPEAVAPPAAETPADETPAVETPAVEPSAVEPAAVEAAERPDAPAPESAAESPASDTESEEISTSPATVESDAEASA